MKDYREERIVRGFIERTAQRVGIGLYGDADDASGAGSGPRGMVRLLRYLETGRVWLLRGT
jgi:hypothetical protein